MDQVSMDDSAKQVLLIESSESVASQVESSLSKGGGFELQLCRDLTSALNCLRISSFDVVVLDISLPDSTGIASLIAVRNVCTDTPIVVLGEDQDPSVGLLALGEGAQDYLSKATWNPASLPRILRYAIERHITARHSGPPEQRTAADIHWGQGWSWYNYR